MGGKTASTTTGGAASASSATGIAHGGRLADARRLFPDLTDPITDLSTGINPVPYPVPVLPPDAWSRLPEPDDLAALEAIAAQAYGAKTGQIVAAAGTQILISLIPRLFPAKSVAIVGPTYAEHAVAWARAANVTEVGSLDESTGYDVVVVCNPNNPDGQRTDPGRLVVLAEELAARNGLLVVDEAFADLEDGPLSIVPDLPDRGVVVLRSFGKTYGLAGLRLGFAAAGPEIASKIRDAMGPWAVSGAAIAIGREALADAAWLDATRARLDRDIRRLDALLTGAGLRIVGGTRLFRLAESPDAPAVFDRLGRAGIFVRRFAANPVWLRFGIPADDAAWARLAAALE